MKHKILSMVISSRDEWLDLQSRVSSVSIVVLFAVIAVAQAGSWGQAAVIAPGFLAAAVYAALLTPGVSGWRPVLDSAVLVLTGATWAAACAFGMHYSAGTSLAFVAAALAVRTPRRPLVAVAVVASVALPPLVAGSRGIIDPWYYLAMEAGLTAVLTGVLAATAYRLALFREERRARESAAELAAARERTRLAHDLHDVQGHTLHLLNFKLAAVKVLIDTDPARARAELDQSRSLVTDAIRQSADLVHGRHTILLYQELSNTVRLLEAVGATVDVATGPRPPEYADSPFAHVLREATTNILRHAAPTTVTIHLDTYRLRVTNDGASRQAGDTSGRGLGGLAARLEEIGGGLDILREDDTFVLEAYLPARSAS